MTYIYIRNPFKKLCTTNLQSDRNKCCHSKTSNCGEQLTAIFPIILSIKLSNGMENFELIQVNNKLQRKMVT